MIAYPYHLIFNRVLEDTAHISGEAYIPLKASIIAEKERYIVPIAQYIKLQLAAKDYTHE